MIWFLDLACGLVAVDLVSGLVHWAEDTFGTETTPLVGRWIVAPNVLHHADASAFVARSWLASSWDLALAAALVAAIAITGGWFGPGVAAFTLLGANANQIHKWCHAPARAPRLVRAAWRVGLLQGPAHHARHHRGRKNQAYCVVTAFVNPVLDRLGFWRALERCTVPFTGAPRREDLCAPRKTGRPPGADDPSAAAASRPREAARAACDPDERRVRATG